MVVHDEIATTMYAPLRAQRHGRRERALTTLYARHNGRAAEPLPGGALLDSASGAARPYWQRLVEVVGRVLGDRRFRNRHAPPPGAERRMVVSGAAAEAALAQHITGPGSGPYSGTPFPPADGAGRTVAAGGLSEAERHARGIIDDSRHVSSVGRR